MAASSRVSFWKVTLRSEKRLTSAATSVKVSASGPVSSYVEVKSSPRPVPRRPPPPRRSHACAARGGPGTPARRREKRREAGERSAHAHHIGVPTEAGYLGAKQPRCTRCVAHDQELRMTGIGKTPRPDPQPHRSRRLPRLPLQSIEANSPDRGESGVGSGGDQVLDDGEQRPDRNAGPALGVVTPCAA